MAKVINNSEIKQLLNKRGVSFVEKNHSNTVRKLKNKGIWHKFINNG